MSRTQWTQALVYAVIVVVAMTVGGVLAVNLSDDGDGAPAAAAVVQSTPETLPVSRVVTPAPEAPAVTPEAAAARPLPDVVEEVRRSVVDLTVITRGTTLGPFGPREFRTEGEGTGIVVDREGHILTNYHVVEGADDVTVTFWDGSVAAGTVVGSDPGNDLAVVRVSVQPQRLSPAVFGDSDAVRVGEPVFAIGNPFSFDFSVTKGIVSGLGRASASNSAGRAIRDVIQIDAAVNPGNSGGPLFNAEGKVIGINTAIHNPTQERVFVGIGLAVPSNTATRFLPAMIAGRDITHAQLGISGRDLNALNAGDLGVAVDRGVYVVTVSSGSAADRSGLHGDTCDCFDGALEGGGDVITAIDGHEVFSIEELASMIDRHDVGDTVTLTVVRDGEQIAVAATLQQWPGS